MYSKAEIKKLLSGDKPTKAIADIVINDAIVIHGVGVVESEKGRFMTMPSVRRRNKQGVSFMRNVCHPISSSARYQMAEELFRAYDEALATANSETKNI